MVGQGSHNESINVSPGEAIHPSRVHYYPPKLFKPGYEMNCEGDRKYQPATEERPFQITLQPDLSRHQPPSDYQ